MEARSSTCPVCAAWSIDADDGIATTFADVERLVGSCRFHDCAHSGEPGCAVAAALTEGTLSVRRFESWQKLQREMEWMRRRTDARLAAEHAKKWRKLTKEQSELSAEPALTPVRDDRAQHQLGPACDGGAAWWS